MVTKISNVNWWLRVMRCASRQPFMGDATKMCRANGVTPNPSMVVMFNPTIKRSK